MENRNRWMIVAAAIAVLTLVSTSSWAGSKQQYRWEGVAIGIGAAILGSTLLHHHGVHVSTPATVVHYSGYRRDHHHRSGHYAYGTHRHWGHPYHRKHQLQGRSHGGPRHKGNFVPRFDHRHSEKRFQPYNDHGRKDHRMEPRHNGNRSGRRF